MDDNSTVEDGKRTNLVDKVYSEFERSVNCTFLILQYGLSANSARVYAARAMHYAQELGSTRKAHAKIKSFESMYGVKLLHK